ncbi:MAG: glycosyltransferase family 4 protein [Pseudomonadales bacterium]|nr:glycosyltransferase family 4 protein [Pseudomonadales bacterium]
MSKLRILVVTTSYPIKKGSVSGIFVKSLVSSMTKKADVTVVTPADKGEKGDVSSGTEKILLCHYAPPRFQSLAHEPGGIPAKLRNNRMQLFFVPLLLASMMWRVFLESRKHDIIFCNWAITGFMVILLKAVIKKPIVTTLRGEDVKPNPVSKNQWLLRICLKYSDKIVLVSNEMCEQLAKEYPQYAFKMQTICNGVDLSFLDQECRFDSVDSMLRLVVVGSLIPRKNHIYIFQALSIIKKRGGFFQLDVIGDGEELNTLIEQAVKYEISENVVFQGTLAPENVANVLSTSHIFLTASLHEGRPNTVLEAMAVGLCVIASDISGHRELINGSECGELFELGSSESLANSLYALLQDPKKIRAYGRNGKQYVSSSSFSWDDCSVAYLELFRQMIKQKLVDGLGQY